jgi:hypothetical protein
VKRLKLGSLDVSVGVEPQGQESAAEANRTMEDSRPPLTGSTGWWWDSRKHPVLAESFVCLLAIGLLAYAAVDPHDLFNSAHGVGGFIAAVLLVIVIGRRALRRVSRH